MTLFGPSKMHEIELFWHQNRPLIYTNFQTSDNRNLRVLCPSSVAVIQKPRKPLECSKTGLGTVETNIYPHFHQSKLHFPPAVVVTWKLLLKFCFFPVMMTQVIEQINHQMRKGSKSQMESIGSRSGAACGSSLQLRF